MTWQDVLSALDRLTSEKCRLFRPGATDAQLAAFTSLFPSVPPHLLTVLRRFDGEHYDNEESAALPGCRFEASVGIANTAGTIRDLVEQGDLPSSLLHFVPFLHTGLKTSVGVFADSSPFQPGSVAEYSFERGELVIWAMSFQQFLQNIVSVLNGQSIPMPGNAFPSEEGLGIVDIATLPGWPDQ